MQRVTLGQMKSKIQRFLSKLFSFFKQVQFFVAKFIEIICSNGGLMRAWIQKEFI